MTHTDSKYLSDAAGQTRTEEQARRELAIKRVRDQAEANAASERMAHDAEMSMRNVFSLRDAIMGAGK